MGLDLALGVLILISGIRGWIKGFMSQAVRIAGFVACFYLADPLREQARPYVLTYLPKIETGLMDRILWWVAAVVSYVLLVGLTTLAIQTAKRPQAPGESNSARNDQFAGFFLGAAKGALVAAFIAAGVEKYAPEFVNKTAWAEHQLTGSFALKWTEQYKPVPRIWATPAVRRFVEHIQRNGLKTPFATETDEDNQVAERAGLDAGHQAPRLELDPESPSSRDSAADPRGLSEIERAVEDLKTELRARALDSD
jgi:uncharacterized membrane protein required for colicin V production